MPIETSSMDARKLLSEPLSLVHSFSHLPVTSLPAAIHEVVSGALAAGSNWELVPSLNSVKLLESLPPRTLVRLKCMVADVLDPEFYSAEMTVADAQGNRRSMRVLYEDQLHLPEGFVEVNSFDQSALLQRTSLVCVPVPGEAPWAIELYAAATPLSTAPAPATSARKRGAALDDWQHSDASVAAEQCNDGSDSARKKSGGVISDLTNGSVTADAVVASSLPKHAGSSSAIVNVYHDGDALKMFDTVEFFGVLAVASLDSSLIGEFDDGFSVAAPPASAVPRFHAITYRRLKTAHPLTSGCVCSSVPHVSAAAVPSLAAAAKSALLQSLCLALATDADCAAQLLLCIMSNVQDRVSGEAIGSYSLNLRLPASSASGAARGSTLFADGVAGCSGSNFVVDRLWQLLCAVLPARRRLLVSIPALNQGLISPKKDYSTGELLLGAASVAQGSFLLIDETGLEAGQLVEQGVKNVQAINSLVVAKEIVADYGFYPVTLPLDATTLMISKGKSMWQGDAAVQLQSATASGDFMPNAEALNAIRSWIAVGQATVPTLGDDLTAAIPEDFVKQRQADSRVNAQDLGRWLTMAKLLARVNGLPSVSRDCWEEALRLDRQCRAT